MTMIKMTAGLAALLALMACEPEKKDAMMGADAMGASDNMAHGDGMMSEGEKMEGDTMMSGG
ncbi:MAG TPA: hypothetical protein ENJ26_00040 [Rhodobacteraceae bacterium]|nr:hypothetical protein [Paracoccaceae bacterium]